MSLNTDVEGVLFRVRRLVESFVASDHGSMEERLELVAGLELMADTIQMLANRVAELERRERQRLARPRTFVRRARSRWWPRVT